MKVLVYRKCSTCMKALKWLDEHNINYEERAIKEENPTYEELKKWYAKSGLPLKKFFNTGGMIYKEMGLKDKLKDMSEDEQLKLLATDGMLVKRPLVIGDDFVLTGFREKEWSEAMHMIRRACVLGAAARQRPRAARDPDGRDERHHPAA